MNIINIFFQSNTLIQIIMLVLLFFSILSWSIIIHQTYVLHSITREITKFENKFCSGTPLIKLYQNSVIRRSILKGMEYIFYSGFQKFSQLYHVNNYTLKDTIKETEQTMHISIEMELKQLETYVVFLSTISTISPYLGLLGTILSMIHIFFKLGESTDKYITLQIITPGAAEALMFTAEGLFVAIPSTIAYYYLNFHIENIEKKYKIFLKQFLSILNSQIFLKKI